MLLHMVIIFFNDNNISYFSGLDHHFVFGLNNDTTITSDSIVLKVYY